MGQIAAPENVQEYFSRLKERVLEAYELAKEARGRTGIDPEVEVDIVISDDVAERVEGLISSVAPEVKGVGIPQRIRELEGEYGPKDWRIALRIAREVSEEKFCKFESRIKAIEVGIRVGLAYVTSGVVSAPLEGFVEARLKKRRDGQDYLAIYFAGPIRGAGGTASAICVIISDYLRIVHGILPYDPDEKEIFRYQAEILDYFTKVAKKQYTPSGQEIEFLVRHIPVEVTGDPTERFEVLVGKRLPRVETDRVRSGMCLVLAEGVALKSSKLKKQLDRWGREFGLEWGWLLEFIKLKEEVVSKIEKSGIVQEGNGEGVPDYLKPNMYYLADLVAGRPILSYPFGAGGFRLRYGRGRTNGHGSFAISPISMYVLKDMIGIGTQLKIERPGKSTALSSCDFIEGPIVKLKDGSVVFILDEETAKRVRGQIKEILFLGDILVSHGDFSEQGNRLMPAGWCEEWHELEIERELEKMGLEIIGESLCKVTGLDLELCENILKNPIKAKVSFLDALIISKKLNVPLHPRYTYHFMDVGFERVKGLYEFLKEQKFDINKLELELDSKNKRVLEELGVPHKYLDNKVIFDLDFGLALLFSFGLVDLDLQNNFVFVKKELNGMTSEAPKNSLEFVNLLCSVGIRDKSGFYIGCRMGRPEKAKMRKMKGSPHVLFPVGEEGGRLRSFIEAGRVGFVEANFPIYRCESCKKESVYPYCYECGKNSLKVNVCLGCNKLTGERSCHGETKSYRRRKININDVMRQAERIVGMKPELVKGVRGTSNKDHVIEHLGKGILRAKHKVYVNKDGTIRYDATEAVITHFRPREIGLSVERARELGYLHDCYGNKLVSDEQLCEIFVQDVIIPCCPESDDEGCDEVLIRTSRFIDEELTKLYGMKGFYNIKKKEELIGQLVIGLAPHTSAGIIGRIIGFSSTQTHLGHPYWHDAQRRDIDGDETCIMLLMDAFLNFSRQFLPDSRGSRSMDAPLVLSILLNPQEIDEEVYDLDTVQRYPIELYEKSLIYANAWDVKVEQVKNRIGKREQFCNLWFTHDTSDINLGVRNSSYKSLPTMVEKISYQMELANKIRAVDENEVAALVVEKHLIRDIKGNLRQFASQEYRCVKCNEKFRAPPFSEFCRCGGRLIFTVSEGTVLKYFDSIKELTKADAIPEYLKSSIRVLQKRVEAVFGREESKQVGLAGFG